MSEKKAALIVGCGRIAGGYNRSAADAKILTHALAYTRHPAYELAACVDTDGETRSAFMKKWNVPNGYSTLDDALKAQQYDIVSVCSSTGTHLPALKRLLTASPKAVFVEKPLDGKAGEARALGASFAKMKIPVAVNFGRRFDRFIQMLRSEIASGKLGKLRSVAGWYSGGVLNNGSHLIDLVIFLTGRVPVVTSVAGQGAAGSSSDPTVSALLDLGGGVAFHLIASQIEGAVRFELELGFEREIVTLEDSGQAMRRRQYAPSPLVPEVNVAGRGEWRTADESAPMLAALDELMQWKPGARLSSDIESACDAIEVAVAIRDQALEKIS